jgi:general secretion pathway protein H
LVVLLIASLLVSLAVIGISVGGPEERLREEADRVWQLMRLAADESVLQSRQLGLRFGEAEYAFYELQEADGKWVPMTGDARLRRRDIPEGMEAEVEIEGLRVALQDLEKADKPQIFFLSSGEIYPEFVVFVRDPELDLGYRIMPGRRVDLVLEAEES